MMQLPIKSAVLFVRGNDFGTPAALLIDAFRHSPVSCAMLACQRIRPPSTATAM